jgi:bacterioferritin (cytochrome b1)
MAADPRVIELFSYYREGELHGANLLLRLMKYLEDDPEAQIKLTLHVAEEMQHAWLWTKRMMELRSGPVPVRAGYQTRIGLRTVPRSLVDLIALTIVVEERSFTRYREHAARPNVDAATRQVLLAVSKDEKWHIAWMKNKLAALTEDDPGAAARAREVMERYRQIDQEVYAELLARERELFGDALSVPAPGDALPMDAAELVRSGGPLPSA